MPKMEILKVDDCGMDTQSETNSNKRSLFLGISKCQPPAWREFHPLFQPPLADVLKLQARKGPRAFGVAALLKPRIHNADSVSFIC